MTTEALGASVAVLALVGFLDSLYFVLVAYRWVRPDTRWVPLVCRMDEGTCAQIVDTREGHLFGPPNGVFGLAFYGMVLVASLAAAWTGAWTACWILLASSGLALATSVYLAWTLIFRLRVLCVLCFLSHAINLLLVGAFAYACL